MKLTKALLIKSIRPGMESLGFRWFKDSISGAQGLFAKKVNDDLYLTVGMTIHRYYDDAFTADLYLSKTTTLYCTWGDIPSDCSIRPGQLMTDKELQKYEDGYTQDIWWKCEDSVDDFLHALQLTEPRLCNNEDLIKRINSSKDIDELSTISDRIKEKHNSVPDMDYSFIPEKEIDIIPLDWFKASEYVLRKMGRNINPRLVKRHASDAYIQHVLDNL